MSTTDLIKAIEAKQFPVHLGSKDISTPTPCVALDTVIDLINEAHKDKVIVPVEQARKSELWDGLLNSQRIRIIGAAGMDSPEGEYRHFGMEIWSKYGVKGEYDFTEDNKYGKEVLENYASSTYKAMLGTINIEGEGNG